MFSSAVTMRPLMSLPSASVVRDLRAGELLRLDHLAQPDRLAVGVWHLHADRRFAGHALDQHAFGLERQREVFVQAGDARELDARLGLEFEGRNHRAGIDLRYRAAHVELGALAGEHLRQPLQLDFIEFAAFVRAVQKRGGGQLVAALHAGQGGLGFSLASRPAR